MNPDAYMPFYFRAFWEAVEGLPDATTVAYLRCITYYWGHNHCEGLDDDGEFLRKLCRCSEPDWPAIKEMIFDNNRFFTLGENGKWLQIRATAEWKKSKMLYDRNVAGGKNRWKSVSEQEHSNIARGGATKKWKQAQRLSD